MKNIENKIVRLYICNKCHCRIKDQQPFTRYRNEFFCDTCFLQYTEEIKLSDFMVRDILIENDLENDQTWLINSIDYKNS